MNGVHTRQLNRIARGEIELNKFYNIDCMEYMATVPDKFFELAIVGPPYGLDCSKWRVNG